MAFSFGSGTTAGRTDTIWELEEKILMVLDGGGGGGGNGQVKAYTAADPNTEGIVPADQNQAAIAYDGNSARQNPTYNWDTVNHVWF